MSTKNTSATATPEAIAPPATGEQIEHIMDMWRRRLKGRGVTLDEANFLIQNGGRYLPVMDAAADVLVDKIRSDKANTIIRMVRNIQRTRTAEQAIDATGRAKYIDNKVLATMPFGQGPEEVELQYFKLGRFASPKEVAAEFESRNMDPDPQAQTRDNEADPAFADEHPNGTQWNLDGNIASYLTFNRDFDDERYVDCDRFDSGWDDYWWFAGVVRK
jgi:hypothetical protein